MHYNHEFKKTWFIVVIVATVYYCSNDSELWKDIRFYAYIDTHFFFYLVLFYYTETQSSFLLCQSKSMEKERFLQSIIYRHKIQE